MTKRLISFLIALCLLIAIPLSARYKYNPFTRKLDYYETGADIDLGDLADVTLTGLATGNVLYYDGSAWVNLATGANTQFLTLAAGIPAWQAIPAGIVTFVGLNDTPVNYAGSGSYMVRVNAGANALVFGAESAIDHDGLTNYLAAQHLTLPATIATVLTDHTLVIHTGLGLFDASADVDHDATTNWVANKHIDWTAATQELDITKATTLLIDLNPGFTGSGVVMEIAPSAVISTVDAEWDGINIDGSALDPSAANVEIHGLHVDFSGVSTAQSPYIEGIRVTTPMGVTGERIYSFWANCGIYLTQMLSPMAPGASGTTIDVVYNTTGATGGMVHALDVAEAGTGTVSVAAIGTHTGVDVIHQHVGTITAFDQVWEYDNDGPGWTDITAACASSVVDVQIYEDAGDMVYFGQDVVFDEIVNVWATAATRNLSLDFHYSIGGSGWTEFDPSDDTAGATITGSVRFLASDLAGWAVDTVNGTANKYWIRITRTKVPGVGPTEDTIQYVAGVSYTWAANGEISIKDITVTTPVNVYGLSHNSFADYDANKHVDHTAVSVLSGGLITGGGTIDGNQTLTLTEATIETAIDTLANLTSIQGQTVTFSGSLNVEANSNINQDVTTDASGVQFADITLDDGLVVNDDGTTGEVGINFYSINSTFSTIAQSDAEGIASKSDLRIGLDETLRSLIIADRGDIGTDFGTTAFLYPSLVFVDAAGDDYSYIAMENNTWTFINVTGGDFYFEAVDFFMYMITAGGGDITSTDPIFWYGTYEDGSAEFVNSSGVQTWFGLYPWVNQTGTAAYRAFVVDATETSTGSGANELMTLQVGSTDVFTIGNKGSLDLTMSDALSRAVIAQSAVAGTENQPLISIDDDRTGTTADEPGEASLVINAAGVYAFYVQTGTARFTDDFQIAFNAAAENMTITQSSGTGTEDVPLVKIQDDRGGATVDEKGEASLYIKGDAPAGFVLYVNDGQSQFDGDLTLTEDVFITWADALDKMVIAQASASGTEGQPLILIDDDRVGATVSDYTEATIYIDTAANRAMYVSGGYGIELDGNAGLTSAGTITAESSVIWSSKWDTVWDSNGTADSIFTWRYYNYGANDTSAIFVTKENPYDMTTHDDYESPTFVITNSEGADTNDYAGVVIGERAQASVLVAHYFDFYAMTGSADAAVDPNAAEIAAIFRFGANGTGVPGQATTPGDVLMEGNLEVDGDIYVDGNDIKPSGILTIQTSAAASATYVQILGNDPAVGIGTLSLYDEGQDDSLVFSCMFGTGLIETLGVAPGPLWVMGSSDQDIVFWPAANVNNPWFYIYGGMGGPQAYLRMQVNSSGDTIIEPQYDLSIKKGDGVYSFTVDFDDADPQTLCVVADGYVITDCWIEVTVAWDGNGYIEVGDGGDDDGFMNNTNYDDSTPGYYGFDIADRGDYLNNGLQYIYTGADTIDIAVNTGTSTQGQATVYVHITRLK